MLSSTRTGRYLELDERQVFLWHAVDGENTVRDLLFAYADRYGELGLPRIESALAAFAVPPPWTLRRPSSASATVSPRLR
ncbi:hypothetical protein [Streptomyces sp. NBC_00996]|uniref:hypothetical protein n=1 Tax=Streptomyces sp. NBC_00996 TaxID=2903710 RepID=UPI003867A8B8|nr:hypothetical protein OG390_07530 [Streptomyces sp. NBC_00996]